MIAQLAIERHHEQAAAVAAENDEARQVDLLRLADLLLAGDPANADEVAHVAKDRLQLTDSELVEMERAIEQGRRLAGQALVAERLADDLRAERMRRAARRFCADRAAAMDDARVAYAESASRLARDAAGELHQLADKYPHLFDRSTDIPRLRTDDAEQVGDGAHAQACRKRAQIRLERVEREIATAETFIGRDRGDADLWRAWLRTLRADQRRLRSELDVLSNADTPTEGKDSTDADE